MIDSINQKLEKELSYLVEHMKENTQKTKDIKRMQRKMNKLKIEQKQLFDRLEKLSKLVV